MQFLYPQFLWALLALAIPIIIHLFYFKRFKKVLFTNVRFLKEIKEETSARNKLKNLLVLLSRMLALAFLVFAFAKPFIPLKNDAKQGKSAISIFVDNSFSMSATQGNTPLLPIAKNKALEIINSYSDDDRFQILSNEFAGNQQRLLSKDDAINMLDEIELTPSAKTMSRIINRQKQLLDNSNDNKIAYVLSDFQSSIVDDFDLQDSTFELNLVPIQSVVEKNVSIDSVWFESQIPMVDQNNTLLIRVSNLSLEDANGMILSYAKDGEEKPISTLDIPAKTSVIDTVSIPLFKTGNHEVVVKINDGAISFDDNYYISFDVANQVKVLAINQSVPNTYITKSFEGIHFFELENMPASQINYQTFNTFNLIILNELDQLSSGLIAEIKKYVETGGKLLVFPSDKADINSYNNLLNSFKSNTLIAKDDTKLAVSKINTEEFIFNDVFDRITNNLKLPKTSLHYARTKFQNKLDENLLTFRDNSSFLSKTTFGEGILYFCSSPLSTKYNDLSQVGEIFIPMLYKMVLAKVKPEKLAYTIGQDNFLEVDAANVKENSLFKIKTDQEFIPGQTKFGKRVLLDLNNEVENAGFAELTLDNQTIKNIAFNYDRLESDPTLIDVDGLKEKIKATDLNIFDKSETANIKESIHDKDKGMSLWIWCLILALLFLGIESLLLRFWHS